MLQFRGACNKLPSMIIRNLGVLGANFKVKSSTISCLAKE